VRLALRYPGRLCGSLTASSFDWVAESGLGLGVQRRRACSKDHNVLITAPSTRVVTPNAGNLHTFRAGREGAVMLDFIAPPYRSGKRECTYYTQHGPVDSNGCAELIPGPDPDSLDMFLLPYRGPRLA
jgi:hypothetical protein